jgi:hypothetical protein
MAKNLLHCETGFGVYRSTQLGHIPFILLLYLLVGPSIVPPIGSDIGGSGNLSTSLSNVAMLAADPKFVWVFNANCDGTIIYNKPV